MRAEAAAASGKMHEAAALLEAAAMDGDAEAAFMLAMWRLTGSHVERNLPIARKWFLDAAKRGHIEARSIYTAFLANGTGGQRSWNEALAWLRDDAPNDADARSQLELLSRMALDAEGDPLHRCIAERVSDTPHVVLFRGFLSPEECDYLAAAAAPYFQPADVVDPATGRTIRHPVRTSDWTSFPFAYENPAIHAINRRIAAASDTGVEQGEPLQILRYAPGQEYRPHSDALPGTSNQRLHTMIIYLNIGYEGGETHFLANGLAIRGGKGDAILFDNAAPDGTPDRNAVHAGLPVTSGTKLIASRWIRLRALDLATGG